MLHRRKKQAVNYICSKLDLRRSPVDRLEILRMITGDVQSTSDDHKQMLSNHCSLLKCSVSSLRFDSVKQQDHHDRRNETLQSSAGFVSSHQELKHTVWEKQPLYGSVPALLHTDLPVSVKVITDSIECACVCVSGVNAGAAG